jgi:hypothetical protein
MNVTACILKRNQTQPEAELYRSKYHTSFRFQSNEPFTIRGRRARKMILVWPDTMNKEAGRRDRKIFSKVSVKSKLSRHPYTAGPKVSSFRHSKKAIIDD